MGDCTTTTWSRYKTVPPSWSASFCRCRCVEQDACELCANKNLLYGVLVNNDKLGVFGFSKPLTSTRTVKLWVTSVAVCRDVEGFRWRFFFLWLLAEENWCKCLQQLVVSNYKLNMKMNWNWCFYMTSFGSEWSSNQTQFQLQVPSKWSPY